MTMQNTTTPSAAAAASSSGVINNTGLPGEYAEPATFAPVQVVGRTESAELSREADRELHEAVLLCSSLHGVLTRAAATARNAARTHLLATLNLACVLKQISLRCAVGRVAFGALFAGYKGNMKAREAALAISGSGGFPFTYATARNYTKVLEAVVQRMQEAGGLTPAVVAQSLSDHTAALLTGAYDDPQEATELMWGRWLTAGSLREAYLELAPEKPQPTAGEKLDAAADEAEPVSLEALRAAFLSKSGGWLDSFSGYVDEMAGRVTAQERETVAAKLEALAARIRAAKTRPMLPPTA